ncbi:hypothetical protein [Paremcibacter congregatus]|uniref:hypothetical protein n=1 Tax=Paremcibacter congregatus TaxID=2043170 RepID=UPI003A8CF342
MLNLKGLGKFMCLAPVIVISGCSNTGQDAGARLAADDLWDWMAAERTKPLPQEPETGEPGRGDSALPPPADLGTGTRTPLTAEARAGYMQTLMTATERYGVIDKAIARAMTLLRSIPATDPETRQQHQGAVELQMSRLTSLQKNIETALQALKEDPDALSLPPAAESRQLLSTLAARQATVRRELDDLTAGL